jgi:hypothetical protein
VASLGAVNTLRVDVKGAAVRQELARAGLLSVLIKGPALSRLLHDGQRVRDYSDVDLLLDPSAVRTAEHVLSTLGFRRFEKESLVMQSDVAIGRAVGAQGASHATTWVRDRDSLVIDLHDSLPQVGVPPSVVWERLTRHLEVIDVAGESTETLDPAATALLIALHAAHHGPGWSRTNTDLARALEVLEFDCWLAARDLASSLNAERAMGIGLSLNPDGRALAEQLYLPAEPTVAHRLLWSGAPWSTSVVQSLRHMDSSRGRAAVLVRILWPSRAAMRRGSALARRGRRGLAAAYLARSVQLARALWLALRDLRGRA